MSVSPTDSSSQVTQYADAKLITIPRSRRSRIMDEVAIRVEDIRKRIGNKIPFVEICQ